MQTILFTGGGTAGHVTPNIAIMNKFLASGWKVIYVGSRHGIEREIIEKHELPYFSIATGKLRRYFSWRTFVEPFAILLGIFQAFIFCYKVKPKVIFSKGGFVSFPVVVGAWLNRIPVIIHESDFTPGLANKMSFPFATKICVTFEEGKQNIDSKKSVFTGIPIRESLLKGLPEKGRALCQFNDTDPVLLILGGGQGSMIINQNIRVILPRLIKKFQVAHVCGKGKVDPSFSNKQYKQFEYLNDELADILACSELVISRAGATSLYELLRLKKPHILIPLSRRASRGDQILNAKYFSEKGLSTVLLEEELSSEHLLEMIEKIYSRRVELQQKLSDFSLPDSTQIIYTEILKTLEQTKVVPRPQTLEKKEKT